MARVFAPARWIGAGAPEVQSMKYDDAQTFKKGEVLIAGATYEIQVASADVVASIVGVALEDAGSRPGYELGHTTALKQVTYRKQEVSVAKANASTIFSGAGSSAAAATYIGTDYALTVSSNVWTVDLTDETNVAVQIVDVDVDRNIFLFKFLASVLRDP